MKVKLEDIIEAIEFTSDDIYRKRQNEFRFERLRRAGRVPRSG